MVSENTFLRILLAIVVVIVLIPLLMMAFMMPMMGMMGSGHMADGTSSGGGMWMWLPMLLVPLIIVGGIGYLLYRVLHQSGDVVSDPALKELRTAYARGELSDEEFESRRSRLQHEE